MRERRRPRRELAFDAIMVFLADELGVSLHELPFTPDSIRLVEDGDDAWSFLIVHEDENGDGDTTSYVHHNLRIEWYGTRWTKEMGERDGAA